MEHDWNLDFDRSNLRINVLVWCCKSCGCLQIKKGGLEAPSTYRRRGTMDPFEMLQQEPPCRGHGTRLRGAPALTRA